MLRWRIKSNTRLLWVVASRRVSRESGITNSIAPALWDMMESNGTGLYLEEDGVDQFQHAVQCAMLAHKDYAGNAMITACFLHDCGNIMPDVMVSAITNGCTVERGKTGRRCHGAIGGMLLHKLGFPDSVVVPVTLHAKAKQYLVTRNAGYKNQLSGASVATMVEQGGIMSPEECQIFENNPYFKSAITLRKYDDAAKRPVAQESSWCNTSIRGIIVKAMGYALRGRD